MIFLIPVSKVGQNEEKAKQVRSRVTLVLLFPRYAQVFSLTKSKYFLFSWYLFTNQMFFA